MMLLLEIFENLFIQMPITLSRVIVSSFKSGFYWVLAGSCLLVGVILTVLNRMAETGTHWDKIKNSYDALWLILIFYGAYIGITSPVFLTFTYLKQEHFTKGLKPGKKFRFSAESMAVFRERAAEEEVFLGRSMKTRKNIYLNREMRKMHTHVVGSTGAGKTESLVLPLFAQDIARGTGALIMDAKGDRETLNKIYYYVKELGREKDFLFFSLAYPEKSNTYNPLLRGNPTELKDKIISANIWTEEFYKKKAEETLLLLMKSLCEAKQVVTFEKLYDLLSNERKLAELAKQLTDAHLKEMVMNILKKYTVFQKDLSGMTADLGMISESEFSGLLRDEKPQIDLLDAYLKRKIVYFQLNAQGYEETARRFGRIVLQDLKTISNYIQAYLPEDKRFFFPIFVDEFSNFAYEQFVEFLNKARGAHLAITIAHQSLGDLQKAGDHFLKQVLENCNIKVVMRQDDPASIEMYSRISGTEKTFKDTMQTQEDWIDKSPTGMVSVREVEEFRLNPNLIRELGRGEAAVIIKQPFVIDVLQLDYRGHIPQVEIM